MTSYYHCNGGQDFNAQISGGKFSVRNTSSQVANTICKAVWWGVVKGWDCGARLLRTKSQPLTSSPVGILREF